MPCDESVPLQRGSEGSLPTPALSSYSGDGEYDGYGDGYRDGYGDGYGDGSEFRASPHSRTPVQNLPAPLPSSLRPELTLGGGSPEPDSGLVSDNVAFCQPSHAVCSAHTGGGDDGGSWNCTTKDLVSLGPLAKEKLCPKPGAAHSAPFQPSPGARCAECLQPSVISRVHVAPSATANGMLEVYGAPPLSVVSSEQLRLQPTSPGNPPPEQVIAEEIVGAAGGEGGEGGAGGPAGGKEIKLTEVELTEVELTEVELTEVEFTELNFLGTCCGVLNHMLRLCMLRFCMLQRRWLMSVMAETHQVIAEEIVGAAGGEGGGESGGDGGGCRGCCDGGHDGAESANGSKARQDSSSKARRSMAERDQENSLVAASLSPW